jgi:phosphate uptake regulator
MKRKIIKQGHNTMTMTLPTKWIRDLNLKPGKEVDVIQRGNNLLVSSMKTKGLKKTEFDITGMDIPLIWKYFMAAYREGYDEIKVKVPTNTKLENTYKFLTTHRLDKKYQMSKTKKRISEIMQGFTNRFIGLEIVDTGKDFVIIKEMGEPTSKEFDNSLRRVFLLVQQMAEDTLESIQSEDFSILEGIHDVDINLDKFHDYCIRMLNKVGHRESKESSLLFSTLYILELIGDEFKNISNHIINFPKKSNIKNIEKMARVTKNQIDLFYSLFYKFDIEKVKKISQMDKEMYAEVPKTYKKSNEEEKEIYHHLRIIARYINALLELRVEMNF